MTTPCGLATTRRLIAVALATLLSGCSFVSMQRPRPPIAVEDPRVLDTCTTSSGTAVADTVLGSAALIAGYVALIVTAIDECFDTANCSSGSPGAGLAIMGAGAVYAGSAVYGYVSAAQCRRRMVAGGRCASGDVFACQKLKPGWVPPPEWRAGGILEPRTPASSPTVLAPVSRSADTEVRAP